MNYCKIDNASTKEHLLKIIDIIYNEVLFAGGDGDALWYSRFYFIDDLKPLIEDYNSKLKFPWEVNMSADGKTINWGNDKEWAIITNDETWSTAPDWMQMKIRY